MIKTTHKELYKLSVISDVYINVLDECLRIGNSPILEELKKDIQKVIDSVEQINKNAYNENKHNTTIQTLSAKFNYIFNKEVK